jgi:1,4-alpha-glucan branching enzyme
VVHENYRIGVPFEKECKEILNSDAKKYFGSGVSNAGKIAVEPIASHSKKQSISIKLPPLSVLVFKGA